MSNLSSVYTIDELYEIAYRGSYTDSERQLAKELLAFREAQGKAVGWTDAQELRDVERDGCGYLFTVNPITPHADMRRVIKLYAVPQLPAVPELVPFPDEFLSSEQNESGMFELSEDCMIRLAVALSQQSKGMVIPAGKVLVPKVPSQAHLNSIAMRYRHDFYLLNDAQKDSALATARQMYEECSGQGFFTIAAAPKPE